MRKSTGKSFIDKIKKYELKTQVANNLCAPPRPFSKSGYKGVIKRGENSYVVRVWSPKPPHKFYVGGTFQTAEEAAKCYDDYMFDNVAEWVYLNFPERKKGYKALS